MSENEQIVEMTMLISEGARPAIEDATAIYEKGYRRQSVVEDEIFAEIRAIIDRNTYKAYIPNSPFWSKEYKFGQILLEIAELEKKRKERREDGSNEN